MNYAKYIGIPFESKGRGPAYDCWGLLIALFEERGIQLPDFREYYDSATDKKNIPLLVYDQQSSWQQIDEPEEGAVVVFNMAGLPFHVGYCIGKEQGKWKFIHVMKNTNVSCEELYSPVWENRIKGFYQYSE